MTGFKLFTAIEITFCYIPAILLSYAPFKTIATKKQKLILCVSDMDLCVLLGNALENAFYGCMTRRDKRRIIVIAQTEEQIVSIVVHNTFDGKIETKDNILLSRKRGNDVGGIGLASMHEVCKRYGGTMETKWDEDRFMVLFLLPV